MSMDLKEKFKDELLNMFWINCPDIEAESEEQLQHVIELIGKDNFISKMFDEAIKEIYNKRNKE